MEYAAVEPVSECRHAGGGASWMRDSFSAIPRLAWRDQHRVGARPARHLDRCGSVAHVPVASRTEALLGHLSVVDRAASCHLRISLRRPSSQLTCSPFTATLSISRPCMLGLLAPMRSRDWRHELTPRLLFADFRWPRPPNRRSLERPAGQYLWTIVKDSEGPCCTRVTH